MPPEQFKRLTGVKRETFGQMLEVLKEGEREKKRAGRPSKLPLEDQLLLTLMYWRENRSQFHIAKSYGIHEANANRTIRKVEDTLSKAEAFKLPGKKQVQEGGIELSFVVVDVTETPIERPKKSSDSSTVAKRSATP